MASSGSSLTKSSIITDFINTVMAPARNTSRISSNSATWPRTNQQLWDNGTIINSYQTPVYGTAYDGYGNPYQYLAYYNTIPISLVCINTAALADSSVGMGDPSVANLPSATISAAEIINTCRSFASSTTRIRRVLYGLRYTQYYNGQYTQTGLPSVNVANGTAPSGVYTGDLNSAVGVAHLTDSYLVSIPASVGNDPVAGQQISAAALNSFYANLRTYANAQTNGSAVVDLRICHTSCHNNCHSSRGRR